MKKFPKIHIVKDGAVEEGRRYRIYVGYKNDEIVCLAISRYGALTIGILHEELPKELRVAVFKETTVFLDVYHNPAFRYPSPLAKLWSQQYMGRFKEEPGGSFLTEENERVWKEALGMMVSFSPYGGPADKPELFPDFPKKT